MLAGNSNSGRNVTFAVSENELQKAIAKYKNDVESGAIARASWPHFCSVLDCTEEEVAAVMGMSGENGSAYQRRAKMLKKMATWVRGQMMSSAGWNGQMTARAIFALKQDLGDGVRWTDRDTGNTGPTSLNVVFGGGDPRAKDAAK